jgi:predicted YcjX-like family ATPase
MERELRIALIGDMGAGKTTFLASFFGNHQRSSFAEQHGYSLIASDTRVSNDLLSAFHGLEQGSFPESTSHARRYTFDVIYRGQRAVEQRMGRSSVVRVTFVDYPGRWFSAGVDSTDRSSGGEERARRETLKWLSEAHLGIVLLDGEKWQKEGPAYARKELSQFRNELEGAAANTADTVPRRWIVALTKADAIESAPSAGELGAVIRQVAQDELRAFDIVFKGSRQIGAHFLLLSSVLAEGGRAIDPGRWLGLGVVVPFALNTVLIEIA